MNCTQFYYAAFMKCLLWLFTEVGFPGHLCDGLHTCRLDSVGPRSLDCASRLDIDATPIMSLALFPSIIVRCWAVSLYLALATTCCFNCSGRRDRESLIFNQSAVKSIVVLHNLIHNLIFIHAIIKSNIWAFSGLN